MHMCYYGCGAEGLFLFKNGRYCCSHSTNKCPAKRQRDAVLKAGKSPPTSTLLAAHASIRGKPAWSKGRTKHTDIRLLHKATQLKNKFESGELIHIPIEHTQESKLKMSLAAKRRGSGGYKPGSGRGKSGWYMGIWCDSSWELAYVIWCQEHNKDIKRCKLRFEYTFEGVTRKYLPDFEVDGQIVEIKGYWTQRDRAKLDQCPVQVQVITQPDIDPILQYAVTKYGKKFIKLYDNKDDGG